MLQSSEAGEDYQATEVEVMLTNEETSKNITISIIDDDLSESLEKFILRLSPSPNSPNHVSLHPISQAVVTIVDDDGRAELAMPIWSVLLTSSSASLYL